MRAPRCSAALLLVGNTLLGVVGPFGRASAQHEDAVAAAAKVYVARHAHVVQPRAVPKTRALELSAAIGVIPSDPLRIYVPLGIRAAFHLNEIWAVEAAFAYLLASERSLFSVLEGSGAEPHAWQRAQQQLRADAALRIAPLYGKLLAGSTVLNMELYALAGVGIVRTLRATALGVDAGVRPAAQLAAGLGLLFGGRWVIRVEYRQSMYARPTSGLAWPAEIGLCGGVLLGGRR